MSTNLVSNVSRIDDLETEVRPANRGGTGINSYTVGDILYASATDTLSTLPIGTSGEFLKTNGTTILWSAISEVTPATAGTLTANTFQYLTSNNGTFNGSADVTFGVDATTTNTTNKIVARDSNGDIFVSGVYGSIKGSNTISASTISGSTGLYGKIVGSNTISASNIYSTDYFGNIVGSNTISSSVVTVSGNITSQNITLTNTDITVSLTDGTLTIDAKEKTYGTAPLVVAESTISSLVYSNLITGAQIVVPILASGGAQAISATLTNVNFYTMTSDVSIAQDKHGLLTLSNLYGNIYMNAIAFS